MLPVPLYTRGEVRRRLGRPAEAVADATEARAQRGYRAAVERRSGSMAARVDRRRSGTVRRLPGPRGRHALPEGAERGGEPAHLLEPGAGLPRPGRGRARRGGPSPECRRPPPSGDRRRPPAHRLLRAGPHRGSDPPRPRRGGRRRARDVRRPGRAMRGPWPAAAAARCRGLLATTTRSRTTSPRRWRGTPGRPRPSSARAPSCARASGGGARGARAKRVPLTSALQTFEALGAEPWADKARRELRATGAAAAAPPASSEPLTPQELQVALTVAGGATNKEAATALLISAKTVRVPPLQGLREARRALERSLQAGWPPQAGRRATGISLIPRACRRRRVEGQASETAEERCRPATRSHSRVPRARMQ